MTNTQTKTQTVAFITYNTLDGITTGWHEREGRRAFVMQNTKGRGAIREGNRTMTVAELSAEIERQWGELQKHLPEIDHAYVYVGAEGSERAIELASKLKPEQVTFIGCRCGLAHKEALVQAAGMDRSRRILCECGGHSTMFAMIVSYLRTGEAVRAPNQG